MPNNVGSHRFGSQPRQKSGHTRAVREGVIYDSGLFARTFEEFGAKLATFGLESVGQSVNAAWTSSTWLGELHVDRGHLLYYHHFCNFA